jgi:hypothetical protein
MGNKDSRESPESPALIVPEYQQFMGQSQDYKWLIQSLPGETKHDSYDERIVETTFSNNLNAKDYEEYVDGKFGNLDDSIRRKMKRLIQINIDDNMGNSGTSSCEEINEPVDQSNRVIIESSVTTTKKILDEHSKTEYYCVDSTENTVSLESDSNGETTATLIQILFEHDRINEKFKINVGYVKFTRKAKHGLDADTLKELWDSHKDRITRGLQYRYGKQLERELNMG